MKDKGATRKEKKEKKGRKNYKTKQNKGRIQKTCYLSSMSNPKNVINFK